MVPALDRLLHLPETRTSRTRKDLNTAGKTKSTTRSFSAGPLVGLYFRPTGGQVNGGALRE